MINFKYLTIIICTLTNLTISQVSTASTSTCIACKTFTDQLKAQIYELEKKNDVLTTKIQGLELELITHKRVLNLNEQGKVFAQLQHQATTYRKRVDELEQKGGNWGAQRQQYTHNQNQSEMSLKNFCPNGIITQLTIERDALKRRVESLEKSEIAQLNNTYYHQLQDALLEIKKLKEAQYDFCDEVN